LARSTRIRATRSLLGLRGSHTSAPQRSSLASLRPHRSPSLGRIGRSAISASRRDLSHVFTQPRPNADFNPSCGPRVQLDLLKTVAPRRTTSRFPGAYSANSAKRRRPAGSTAPVPSPCARSPGPAGPQTRAASRRPQQLRTPMRRWKAARAGEVRAATSGRRRSTERLSRRASRPAQSAG
jgi:hypothetical protein